MKHNVHAPFLLRHSVVTSVSSSHHTAAASSLVVH